MSPLATPEYVSNYGQVAEACGFDSLWLAEHVVLFDGSALRYPSAEDGRVPAGGENGFLETFTALAFLAAKTSRIRLGTGVCLVPQRNPVYTTKEAAAVDWLSDGRLDFGVGVGWQAEAFWAAAAPFERRGARGRAFIDVIKSLWMEPVSSCENDFYCLEPCRLYPKPVQTPHHFSNPRPRSSLRTRSLAIPIPLA